MYNSKQKVGFTTKNTATFQIERTTHIVQQLKYACRVHARYMIPKSRLRPTSTWPWEEKPARERCRTRSYVGGEHDRTFREIHKRRIGRCGLSVTRYRTCGMRETHPQILQIIFPDWLAEKSLGNTTEAIAASCGLEIRPIDLVHV